jgi:HTH-type transcriptional regulator/antitoxin HigA
MDIRPIRDEADYAWALNEVEGYFQHEPDLGTADSDRFEVLSTLIEAYEAKHWALPDADPIAVLRHAIDDLGRTQANLADILGSRSYASEVLARKRPLSLEMIRRISDAWNLPTSLLVSRYTLDQAA